MAQVALLIRFALSHRQRLNAGMKKKPDLRTIARGKALRQLRERAGMTMQQVEAGADQGNISRVTNNGKC